MEITNHLKDIVFNALTKVGVTASKEDIVIEKTKTSAFGDYSTNAAMKYSKVLKLSPRDLANKLIEIIDKSNLDKIEVAGPGFLNFFVKNDSLTEVVGHIIAKGKDYGRGENKSKNICLEFVSANPTGLLHVGTARCAAIGDSLARILSFNGYQVTKEYYINDAGKQIQHLAESIQVRYLELFNIKGTIPEDGYNGQDVIDIAKEIKDQYGDKFVKAPDLEFFKSTGTIKELERIKQTLANFGIVFDVFSSEKNIRNNNAVEKELKFLDKYLYEENDAKLLKTTAFVDDKDRVVVKGNGEFTYFLPDIIYHVNKLSRGFDKLIDILGADHHGYINRMKSALMMHGYPEDILDVVLIQMVRFIENGVEIKASKRSGNAITLQELLDDIGTDATRYFFAMRSPNVHMDFDLNLAVEQSSNNPVYYAQYAHARLCSILDSSKDIKIDESAKLLKEPSEIELVKHLARFASVVETSAKERAPFKITNYIHDLAERIHSFYSECRVIDRDKLDVTSSRLALVKAAQIVMKNALNLVGVSAPEHM